jgi:hypothetical protein
MDDSKSYIENHLSEIVKMIREVEEADGLNKEVMLDLLTVITSVLVSLNQKIKTLNP